jgi:hypothetical protein
LLYLSLSGLVVLVVLAIVTLLYQPGNEKKKTANELQTVVSVVPDEPYDERFKDIPVERQLRYEQTRTNGMLQIAYRMPYLESYKRGGPVDGVDPAFPFAWQYPDLSVRILNNSPRIIMPSEAVFRVSKSTTSQEPLLVVQAGTYRNLVFLNEGWSEVIDPVVSFAITPPESAENDPGPPPQQKVSLRPFTTETKLSIINYVPKEFEDEDEVRVSGAIEYGPRQRRTSVKFRTRILLVLPSAAALPPSFTYKVWLVAGKENASYTVPLHHQGSIKPRKAENFLIRVASDRTATYRLRLSLNASDGTEIGQQEMELGVFVPRSRAKEVKKRAAPP